MTKAMLAGVLCVLLSMAPGIFPQTIDEMIAGSYESVEEFDQLADLSGNTIRHELDILMTREQADALQILQSTEFQKDDPKNIRKRRKAIKDVRNRWTAKTIPYSIASGVFSANDKNTIQQAIDEWQQYTCIRFRPATRNDANKVHFDDGRGCYSYIGMTGSGSQKIGLATGCRFKGVVVHEIGHAVGFYHEQNRPDRDDYVRIIRENIPTKLYYNFKKYPTSAVDTMGVPYDYSSVMHYGGRAFSTGSGYTIRTVNPADQSKIGDRKGLSFNDIWLANLMYKCNEHCDSNKRCPRGAFLGKDCECWCPGYPVRECPSTGTVVTPTPGPTVKTTPQKCEDRNKHCPAWARASARYCSRNDYVRSYCKKSCGFCSDVKPTTVSSCSDTSSDCGGWKERGLCSTFENFMSQNCPMTCDLCSKGNEEPEKQGGSAGLVRGSVLVVVGLLSAFTLMTSLI